MKKILLTIALLLVFATAASAQTPKMFKTYIQGGISLPQEDLGEDWNMGWQGGAKVGLGILPFIEPQAAIFYNRFGKGDDMFADYDYDVEGYDFTSLTYGIEARVNFSQTGTGLFAFAGGGGARIDISEATATNVDIPGLPTSEVKWDPPSETKEYITLGIGYQAKQVFIEARYVKVLDDINLKNIDLSFDEEKTLTYIPISIGFRF